MNREMFIRLKNGSTWQVVGSDRYDAAVGSSPAGITFSEWALSNPSAWAYLAPIVIENDGWALFITTARGRNHAKSMLDMAQTRDDWFSEVLPVKRNERKCLRPLWSSSARGIYRHLSARQAADALVDQEYCCSFEAAILGAYWGKEMFASSSSRAASVTCRSTEDLPVQTAWDIGVDDAMAIWCFQVYPDHIDVVDYYEGQRTWASTNTARGSTLRGYHGSDWMPHDAKVREVGAPGARTRIETLLPAGPQAELGAKRGPDGRRQRGSQGRSHSPGSTPSGARRASKASDPTAPSGTRKARAFKKTPEEQCGPRTAQTGGATCLCPGARRCASPRRRRSRSAFRCPT